MINIDKLARIASEELKSGEEFKATTAGRIVCSGEIVKGFIAATDHRVIVLVNSFFSGSRLLSFTFSQTTEYAYNEKENRFYYAAAGEHYVLKDLPLLPNPKSLENFIKAKKNPEKVTFEATGLTVKK